MTEFKWPRVFATGVLLTGLVVAALFVPIPWYAEAPVIAEPYDVRHVRTVVGGRLAEVKVRPGEIVKAGDVLARLESPELQDRVDQIEVEMAMQAAKIRLAQATGDVVEKALAREHLAALEKQREQLDELTKMLTLRAPISGTVVAGEAVEAPPIDARRRGQSVRWSGRPTDPENLGAWLEPSTHLVSIAPSDDTQVLLHFDQAELEDVRLGDEITLRFESIPDRLYQGTIESIAAEGQSYVEPALASKYGGALATESDQQGRERVIEPVFVGRVKMTELDSVLVPGTRGQALFSRAERPAAHWAWRAFRRVFSMI